jgi:SAM-dependent methyltransferase
MPDVGPRGADARPGAPRQGQVRPPLVGRSTVPQVTEPAHVSTTRDAYDATAERFAERLGTDVDGRAETPLDRALLAAFAEAVGASAAGPVADLGCGPGRIAGFLAARSLQVVGIDLSPAMVAVARRAHPDIPFEVGTLTELPLASGSLAGAVGWYSIIHTPPEHLDAVVCELARVLRPDGLLLLGFQAGAGEAVHRAEAYGAAVSLTSYRHDPEAVVRVLIDAGLSPHARVVRDPELPHETSAQAFILARPTG